MVGSNCSHIGFKDGERQPSLQSDRPNSTPYWEKRSSASSRVCSFPSWPEGPTGWGAREPKSLCSHNWSWDWTSMSQSSRWLRMHTPCSLREQGLPPLLSWRHGAIGIARRAGPCTNMLVLQRKPQEWPVARKGRHMYRSFGANAADRSQGRTENAVLRDLERKLFSWKAQFKMRRPKIGRNPPLLLGTMM